MRCFHITEETTVESEMPFKSGCDENISMKELEKRHYIPGTEKACVLGETVKKGGGAGLDSQGQGPEQAAVSNVHLCSASINQTKDKETQTTEDTEDGRKDQSEKAPSNMETATRHQQVLGKLETIPEDVEPETAPETSVAPQILDTPPSTDPVPAEVLRSYREDLVADRVKVKKVLFIDEVHHEVNVKERQRKTTNEPRQDSTCENNAAYNEPAEPTVEEEKQTDVVTSSLSLLLFNITMPSLDIYNDVSLLESLHKRHWNCFSVIVAALSFNFVFTCIAWWRIEPRFQKTWSWIFLLLQIWPQLKACQV